MRWMLLTAAALLVCAPSNAAVPAATAARVARVATGAEVTLATSSRSAAQWTLARPGVRDLRPKARGTFD